MNSTIDGHNAILFILFMVGMYLIPTIIAGLRGHAQMAAIILVNVFLGWTLLGWFAALVWSATYSPPKPRRVP